MNLPYDVRSETMTCADLEVPTLSACATNADDGSVHLTMTKLHSSRKFTVPVALHGRHGQQFEARILCGDSAQAHNTLEVPTSVWPHDLAGVQRTDTGIEVNLPPASIAAVTFFSPQAA